MLKLLVEFTSVLYFSTLSSSYLETYILACIQSIPTVLESKATHFSMLCFLHPRGNRFLFRSFNSDFVITFYVFLSLQVLNVLPKWYSNGISEPYSLVLGRLCCSIVHSFFSIFLLLLLFSFLFFLFGFVLFH